MKKKLLALLLMATFLLSACGSDSAPLSAPAAAPPPASAPASAPQFSSEAIFRETEATPSDYFRFPTLTPERAGDRRLVYTVSMHLQSSDFLVDMRLLLDTVSQAEGYLVTAEIRGHDIRDARPRDRRADFRFRLPTEELPAFIYFVENHYSILALRQDMQEQTAAYRDTNWQISDLQEEQSQLQASLETNITTEVRNHILDRISEIDREIRRLEAGQENIMQNVLYSTIDITLSEAFAPTGELSPAAWFLIFTGFGLICALVFLLLYLKKKKI